MNKTWGRAAAVLTVGTLMLSGCGGDDEPTATPTPSGSASSSAPASPSSSGSSSGSGSTSPTATPSSSAGSEVPAAARARTEAGAIAFLMFYAELLNRGTLDPQNPPNLFEYADKDCIACKKNQDLITEYAKGGWSVKQSGIRFEDVALASPVDGDKVLVNFTFIEAKQPLYRNGKQTANEVASARTKKAAALKWVSGTWQMFDIENI